MKFIRVASLLIMLSASPSLMASEMAACNDDVDSKICQHYLEGIVDGALMFQSDTLGARLETNGYESRALKYRGGKRFQEANRTYCASRIPDRDKLVDAVSEAVATGTVKDLEQLRTVVGNLLDCQRLQ